jgi:hypothetical protein
VAMQIYRAAVPTPRRVLKPKTELTDADVSTVEALMKVGPPDLVAKLQAVGVVRPVDL